MFASAFKSFTSNIGSNYEVSKQPSATVGVWSIFDAKKKTTGTQASVFIFDRKSLDVSSGGFGARASATSVRKIQDEVVERLKKEANSLARLRHPSILQLVEPVEETRSGGLMFATEPVVASLSGALAQEDRQSTNGNRRGRTLEDENAAKAMSDIELDELEIQKGLLQVAKGLEFLHESAKLVHGNLTPNAIFINTKSDWKIAGMAFAGPPDGADGHQPTPQISLSEVLHHDARIPRNVQLDLDYTSPDFAIDSNINFSADIYSMGLILLACYRTPHTSPIEANSSLSTYKRLFASASTTPSPSNNYLCAESLPRELGQTLPRVLARRPVQRMSASEFQQSEYFDNILVNTVRFLNTLPAKSQAEKSQFLRGLGRVMPQFPPSVLSKKVLSALLDELKDRELLPLILQNVFQIVKVIPSGRDVLADKILPQIRDVFTAKGKSEERDGSREAGLVVILENIQLISELATAKQFKDDVLPIVHVAMESSTHSLVDQALQTLPTVLPVLDFTTVKHDLFPVVANVFSKTSSLSIKVRGLEALGVLCGAAYSNLSSSPDDLAGLAQQERQNKNVSSLDKFTMQEKVVPLLKGIKTKEPAVMMAALRVFNQVGKVADIDFLATEVMPILWSFALGPLLNLSQFKHFMEVIRSLSSKIEREQIKKLQELSSAGTADARPSAVKASSVNATGNQGGSLNNAEDDFERLVLGNKRNESKDAFSGALSEGEKLTQNPPTFSWSSGNSTMPIRNGSGMSSLQPIVPASRSITPDVSATSFPTLQPNTAISSTSAWASPPLPPQPQSQQQRYHTSTINVPMTMQHSRPLQASSHVSGFALPPPPQSGTNIWQTPGNAAAFPQTTTPSLPSNAWQQPSAAPRMPSFTMPSLNPVQPQTLPPPAQPPQPQKSGLDKYQSLL